nr:immunoglobulin light chain junction region [Macaca mulatta]MOV76921.1 immunoglobulin light chain junction region [Macaca mulatta]MOV77273.1 immunoglobulin light chain junction region [Macaca mulatta]MOW08847.1 immunoglobulin light chain junction region [Macaca mulatta]MOW09066.1 immunoglobulin light chain junction region [Macaca mulatta]
CQQNDNSPLTF